MEEGYAACNPMQVGFARAFCDIHCVRDAVIRGDRSIIRHLADRSVGWGFFGFEDLKV